jgi:four helix bundle protein
VRRESVLEGIKKIKAWQLADRFVVEVYRVTRHFPREELYGLTSQLRRAAVSVPANVAEGSQRQHLREYLQFLYIAKASMSEAEYYVHLAQQLGYFKDAEFESVAVIQAEAAKTLYGLIHWLEGQIATGKVTKKDIPTKSAAVSKE